MTPLEKLAREIKEKANKVSKYESGRWRSDNGIIQYETFDYDYPSSKFFCDLPRAANTRNSLVFPENIAEHIASCSPQRIAALMDVVLKQQEALKYYAGDEDGDSCWQEPDNFVPYWTLWENGDCVGADKANEALRYAEERLAALVTNE